MKLLLAIIVAMTLSGCGSTEETSGETPAETAAAMMMQNYFLQPRSCMTIGGITTCQ